MQEPEEITVLNKTIRLLQPVDGFRTSLDSVMLAAACPAQGGDHILDLGCGVGGAGLCVLRRVPGTKLTGIDIQADHIDLALRNAALNSMNSRTAFHPQNILDYVKLIKQENTPPAFDHVILNPPYLEDGTHTPSPRPAKAAAHAHQKEVSLQDWLDAGFYALKSGGSLTIIHRADQSDKIIQGLGKRFGALEIIPLWPRTGQEAKRVIIRARKDRKSPARLHPGLVLHLENGDYTPEADAILRGGAAIS